MLARRNGGGGGGGYRGSLATLFKNSWKSRDMCTPSPPPPVPPALGCRVHAVEMQQMKAMRSKINFDTYYPSKAISNVKRIRLESGRRRCMKTT